MAHARLTRGFALALCLTAAAAHAAAAQSRPADYRDEFLQHFARSSRKIMALAEVMPEALYEWSPMEGVMHVAQVYMHLARYNFTYLDDSLGIPVPEGIELSELESITDKDTVLEIYELSTTHVRESVTRMTEEDLTAGTILYGREVAGWAVLFQLLSHMNEHVGQSVAYARMNGIVPPWSR